MRLIDADALKAEFPENAGSRELWHFTGIWAVIGAAPTIDAEPVVRCENCEHFEIDKHYGNHTCWRTGEDTRHDDYCSRGKRKEES